MDEKLLSRAMAVINTVYHLAGVVSILPGSNAIMNRVNVGGAGNMVRAMKKAGRSVYRLRRFKVVMGSIKI